MSIRNFFRGTLPRTDRMHVGAQGALPLKFGLRIGVLLATVSTSALTGQPALAQETELHEVVVTARKRAESVLNVPVIESVVQQEQLVRAQVTDVRDVGRFVPGLAFGTSPGPNGTVVSIRGVGTTTNDPGVDQSIALVVDGQQFSQGMAYSAALFDVSQVEVLKGPQALFYGKSSPAGVISVRTADPSSVFELIGRAGYEFEARERRGEIIVSGPVTDDLKLRLAAMLSDQDGFYRNAAVAAPGTGAQTPRYDREPRSTYVVRGTALWAPNDRFNARLKVNFAYDHWFNAAVPQWVSCPDGVGPGPAGIPFLGGGEDCHRDRTAYTVDFDPAAFKGVWYNGVHQLKNNLKFGSLEMNYQLSPELTLTSATGLSKSIGRTLVGASDSSFAGPAAILQNKIDRDEFTQEFRLNSNFEGPLNFTGGVFYQDADVFFQSNLLGNTLYRLPAVLTDGLLYMDIKARSAFGQARWEVTPELEIAAGARWTDEKRKLRGDSAVTGTPVPVPLQHDELHSGNWSPELTITYRPTDDLTVFGSLKQAYKSGSFSIGTPLTPNADLSFGDEKVQGGELGVKSRLFDRSLQLELSGYNYLYSGLQVGVSEPAQNGIPTSRTINAGSARVYGLELAGAYRPPIDGLTLNLNAAWTHARFKRLDNVPCWGGQLISEGCDRVLDPRTGRYTAQDLSGVPLSRAPDWQVNFGFSYERPVGNGMTLVLANSNRYVGEFLTFPGRRDDFWQPDFIKVDVSLALQGRDDRWEVAVIGNNITNELTAGSCSNINGQNTSILGGYLTGGTARGPAGVDEVACRMDRGREIWVRLTLRPFN